MPNLQMLSVFTLSSMLSIHMLSVYSVYTFSIHMLSVYGVYIFSIHMLSVYSVSTC